MKRTTLTLTAFLALMLSCDALDLTPHLRVAGIQDATGRYYFQDGPKRIGFRIDPKMRASGGPAKASFTFIDLTAAGMTISKSSLTSDTPFDDANIKKYTDAANLALPSGSTKVVLEQETPNAIAINGWTSHQYLFSHTFYGASVKTSLTFLNYNTKEQLLITITAPAKDFDKVYGRSYSVINSIYEIAPKEDSVQAGT